MQEYLSAFLESYTSCALWCGVMNDNETTEDTAEAEEGDLTKAAVAQLKRDARDFVRAQWDNLQASKLSANQAGHDFWLSRNGHGAGFFDHGNGVFSDLQNAAKVYGEAYLFYRRGRKLSHS